MMEEQTIDLARHLIERPVQIWYGGKPVGWRPPLSWHNANYTGYKLIVWDADGTLRRCTVPGQPCPNNHGEWTLAPMVEAWHRSAGIGPDSYASRTERMYADVHHAIASNQGGVHYGYLSEETAQELLLDLAGSLQGYWNGGTRRFFYDIPWLILMETDPSSPRYKPRPGMILEAMERFQVSPEWTLFVGDMETDKQAAEAAGVDFCWAASLFRPVDQNL